MTFWNNDLGTYSGHHSSFASWWTRHKILATSNGTSTGTVEARPHNLYHSGGFFGVYLEPLSRRQQGPAGKPGPAGDLAVYCRREGLPVGVVPAEARANV